MNSGGNFIETVEFSDWGLCKYAQAELKKSHTKELRGPNKGSMVARCFKIESKEEAKIRLNPKLTIELPDGVSLSQ